MPGAKKKRRKSPSDLPFSKFLREFSEAVSKAQAVEASLGVEAPAKRGQAASDPPTNARLNLLLNPYFPELQAAYDEYSPELWDKVGEWWPFRLLRI